MLIPEAGVGVGSSITERASRGVALASTRAMAEGGELITSVGGPTRLKDDASAQLASFKKVLSRFRGL